MRSAIRSVLTWLLVGCVLAIAVAVVGEWFIEVARDKGWYDQAGQRWDSIAKTVAAFVTSAVVLYPLACLAGLVAGIWLDNILVRRERAPKPRSALISRVPDTRIKVYEPVPPPPATDEDGFNYPYPKAVLQAAIQRRTGTKEARSGEDPHFISLVLAVRNMHSRKLLDCSIVIVGWMREGKWTSIDEPLKHSDRFALSPDSKKNTLLAYRDITDKISNPPFLMPLATRDAPLEENSQYIVSIELRSRYPHATKAAVQLDTGSGLELRATLLEQALGPQAAERA